MLFRRGLRVHQEWTLFFVVLAMFGAYPAASHGQQLRANVTASPSGPTVYAAGKWGEIQIQFTNSDDQPAELFAATYFEDQPGLQYCRQTWIPAKSRLLLSHPILVPSNSPEGLRAFSYRTLLIDPRQENEILIRDSTGGLQPQGFLRNDEKTITAIIDDPDEERRPGSELPYEFTIAALAAAGLGRNLAQLDGPILPASDGAYGSIDQLIIGSNRVTSDGPALSAIRRWLYRGGRLWVMLDRVDPKLLELLLGDGFTSHVLDHVDMTTVRIESTASAGSLEASTQNHDQPVRLVRLEASHVDIAYTVNGWPAAFWKQCGDGKLLVTTLAPEGWMRLAVNAELAPPPTRGPEPRRPDEGPRPNRPAPPEPKKAPPANPQLAALLDGAQGRSYVALSPLAELATEFWSAQNDPLLPASKLEPHVQEYIGNSVPSQWLMTSLLAGFGVSLAAVGTWLWRLGRLELLGAAGPVLATGVSVILLLIGLSVRRSVPPTVASVQLIEPLEGTDEFLASGLTGIYAPDGGQMTITSQHGGWLLPERFGQDLQTARLIWTDLDEWQWKNLALTSGLRNAPFATAGLRETSLEARATFGPEGLRGRLHLGATPGLSDAVLVTREGRMGVDLDQDGNFQAAASSVFSSEQFLAANLLSDEQNRRRRTLIQLLSNPQRSDYPAQPKLLVWTDSLDLGFQFDKTERSLGSALVAVPLTLERPPPATEVAIPSPFLPYRGVIGPDGLAVTGLWDYRRREWQDRSLPSSIWLRFQVPPILLPLEPVNARVTVQVTGPVGKLEIAALRGKEAVPLKTWLDPVGTLALDISDPALLAIEADGGLVLKVSGGDPARPELTKSSVKTSYWRIESLRLELRARTSPGTGDHTESEKEKR